MGEDSSSGKTRARLHFFLYAALLSVVAGLLWGIASLQLSRWAIYQAITLEMPQDKAVSMAESTGNLQTGCATLHWQTQAVDCRFEDAWRIYIINFDPDTKRVNGKRYYFKFTFGHQEPWLAGR